MRLLNRLMTTALLALLALPVAAQELPEGHSEHDGHNHGPTAGNTGSPHGADEPTFSMRREAPWSERTLELAASLPIQEGGRIKPLSTYADFMLLRLNGMRKVKFEDEDKSNLSSIEWLLDTVEVAE